MIGADTFDVTYAVNSLYVLVCIALMTLSIVGISLFYSGLTQHRSCLTMLAIPMITLAVVAVDWFIWGYSLCYSPLSNKYIGNLKFAALRGISGDQLTLVTTRGNIIAANHVLLNGLIKAVCAALTFPGCIAERGRIIPMLLFMIPWCVIIYNPVTYWFWCSNGWLAVGSSNLPVLDFAGGTCIHIVSGFTTLAYSYALGPRNPKILRNYRISSTQNVVVGTFFVVVGWVGFISGCDFVFSSRSVYIIVNVILCTSFSAITWCMMDFYYSATPLAEDSGTERVPRRRFSVVSFTLGLMTGLVVFTPAGGYVCTSGACWKSITMGVVGAIFSNLGTRLKYFLRADDALDMFAVHGIGGIIGSLLTGIFANEGYQSRGGWVEGNWIQLAYQLLGCVVAILHVMVLSALFLHIINLIPGLHLRIDKNYKTRIQEAQSDNTELAGTDIYEFNGEYLHDYMEFAHTFKTKPPGESDSSIRTSTIKNSQNAQFYRKES